MKRRVSGPIEVTKRVVVLASGETERRAVPHLVSHLRDRGVSLVEVRIPPRNRALDARMAENLIKASWFGSVGAPPDKFVLLLDLDGKTSSQVLASYRELPGRLGSEIDATVRFACAQWHLEAWYFADAANLGEWLGRALGQIDTSKPEEIRNPKLHLKHLLGSRVYTARISEDIASRLDASTIAARSPGFQGFLDAIRNGPHRVDG